MTLFLSCILTGSKITQHQHLRKALAMQAAIQQRWQRNNLWTWQVKHVRFFARSLRPLQRHAVLLPTHSHVDLGTIRERPLAVLSHACVLKWCRSQRGGPPLPRQGKQLIIKNIGSRFNRKAIRKVSPYKQAFCSSHDFICIIHTTALEPTGRKRLRSLSKYNIRRPQL